MINYRQLRRARFRRRAIAFAVEWIVPFFVLPLAVLAAFYFASVFGGPKR